MEKLRAWFEQNPVSSEGLLKIYQSILNLGPCLKKTVEQYQGELVSSNEEAVIDILHVLNWVATTVRECQNLINQEYPKYLKICE